MEMAMVWLIGIGLLWGSTNAFLKRGALIADHKKKQDQTSLGSLWGEWTTLLCVWQYLLPFLLNLSASALFVVKLGDLPITLAVPITNAVTFAATAVAGAALGERMHPFYATLGIVLIIAGVALSVS